MIDRHWDGIGSYCHPENKVALGFVEGHVVFKDDSDRAGGIARLPAVAE